MIVTPFQDLKFLGKQISPTFSCFLINNTLLHHFLANWLAHNRKMSEKSVFHEVSSPEMTWQSFPVFWFWSRVFVPHRKRNFTFLVRQNTGKENRYRILFCYTVHWGDFIEQIKKKSVIYTLKLQHTHRLFDDRKWLTSVVFYRAVYSNCSTYLQIWQMDLRGYCTIVTFRRSKIPIF